MRQNTNNIDKEIRVSKKHIHFISLRWVPYGEWLAMSILLYY